MIRSRTFRLLAAGGLAVTLTVAGCSSDSESKPEINAQDVAELADGGQLKLGIGSLPANFNTLHIDGNSTETALLMSATLPSAFTIDAAGAAELNTEYFTKVEQTNNNPQTVVYTINPKAVWSDGTPVTWEDIAAQAHALSGQDPGFQIAGTAGFDRVDRVERGVDDRQAVLTFARPYAEWQGQFAGANVLYPKAVTGTADAFNSLFQAGPTMSSGPFTVSGVDVENQRVTLARSPYWWGDKPKLETISFTVFEDAARIPALERGELDATGVTTLADRQALANKRGITIAQTPAPSYFHLTFNGAEGNVLADPALRLAIAKGIDRQAIVDTVQKGLVDKPEVLNNHVFLRNQTGYRDNSEPVKFSSEQAVSELDRLGWVKAGEFRARDGQPLDIRLVLVDSKVTVDIANAVKAQLAKIGVNLILDIKPGAGFFADFITPGDFDIAMFGWVGDPFPLTGLPQIYAYDPEGTSHDLGPTNYGKIGSPELNALIEQTLAELDPKKAIELANQADRDIFAEVHSLPLFQSHGTVAVNAKLANFGARGMATVDWTQVGFTK